MTLRQYIQFLLCLVIGFVAAVSYSNMSVKSIQFPSFVPTITPKLTPITENTGLPAPPITVTAKTDLTSSGYKKVNVKEYSYACPHVEAIVNKIGETFTFESLYTKETKDEQSAHILYKEHPTYPFFRLKPANEYVILTEDREGDADAATSFQLAEHLISLGFTPRHENAISDLHQQYKLDAYARDNWLYYVELPIGQPQEITISCAPKSLVEQQEFSELNSIIGTAQQNSEAAYTSPYSIIETWSYQDNVYTLTISHLFSGGSGHYWGKINNTWKLLTTTQDQPSCEPFESNKVGEGIQCSRCVEGYNQETGACEKTENSIVAY